jgi:hypothetical protein
MVVVVAPSQYATLATGLTVVDGFTVIVNLSGVPTQLLAVGVTVIVSTTGAVPGLVAVNDGIKSIPLVASPIVELLPVQVYVVPETGLEKLMIAVIAPLQYATFAIGLTVVVGFTVIVNFIGVPTQLSAVGITVMVSTIGTIPVLIVTNDGTESVPLDAHPIVELLPVQAKVVPGTEPVNVIVFVVAPAQKIRSST